MRNGSTSPCEFHEFSNALIVVSFSFQSCISFSIERLHRTPACNIEKNELLQLVYYFREVGGLRTLLFWHSFVSRILLILFHGTQNSWSIMDDPKKATRVKFLKYMNSIVPFRGKNNSCWPNSSFLSSLLYTLFHYITLTCEAGLDIPIVKRKKLNQRESQDFTCDHPTCSGWRQNTNPRLSDVDNRTRIPHPFQLQNSISLRTGYGKATLKSMEGWGCF